ncbi:MAG: GGDEF domain-containing protein [Candidatus Galacturonibacter soehngenii]|nr:GGDEF domain-containing protein [Candidatus Galacturonibacter soehngenii]
MKNFDELYLKWRKNFNYIALLVACITLILELVISPLLFYYLPQTIKLPTFQYILLYIVLPSTINFLLVIIGRRSLSCKRLSERAKNYYSIIILSTQFLVIACVHNVFTITITILCFPIFLTLIYSDKKMTSTITLITVVFVSISIVFALLDSYPNDTFFLLHTFVAYILLFGCYITTILLLNIENAKNDILKASSFKQLQLEELLKCDSLTGLHNMSTFYNMLDTCIKNNETPLTIAVIDIDNFKLVNDTWGHEKGNEVLIYLAAQLQFSCNIYGDVFRYGGEEFTIIFPRTSPLEAKTMIETAQNNLYHYVFDFMPNQRITFSCGIASYPSSTYSPQDFFEMADKVMYQAKLSGKNKVLIG